MENTTEHHVVTWLQENGELKSDCSCGMHWTHPRDRTPEQREEIYQAHVAYFNHKPMQVL